MNALDFPQLEWGDAKALVDAIRSARDPIAQDYFRDIRAPQNELCSTVMTTRVCALAKSLGRNFYHHEGRSIVAVPDHLGPELDVSETGHAPHWEFGVLSAPKYFSFFQEAPLAAYHPNHRSKWRAHEMCHGFVGYFWRADMTRFEAYLGARLNELLPVVHWYYFDEIDRPRCPDHRSQIPTHLCHHCDRAVPYWFEPIERADAFELAEAGFEHFDSEVLACRDEQASGRAFDRYVGPGLKPSFDAVAYMRSHWARLTSFSFGFWAEHFQTDGRDYFSTFDSFVAQIQSCAKSMVSGNISADGAEFETLRREVNEFTLRVLSTSEALDFENEDLERALVDLADVVQDQNTDDLKQAFSEFRAYVSRIDDIDVVLLDGIETHDEKNISAGLRSVSDDATPDLQLFAQSDRFWERGTIAERYDRFLNDRDSDAWTMSAVVCALPRIDLAGERFASIPQNVRALEGGLLRVNETFRTVDAVSYGYHFLGTFRIVPRNETTEHVLRSVSDESVDLDSIDVPTLLEFIEQGLVLWFPEAR